MICTGDCEGALLGVFVGEILGERVGALLGVRLGARVGELLGLLLGGRVGVILGARLGERLGVVGVWVGERVAPHTSIWLTVARFSVYDISLAASLGEVISREEAST